MGVDCCKDYVCLHAHSHKSFGDSILTTDRLVNGAKEHNYAAVCLSDHGSLVEMPNYVQTAEKAGIKWIIGMEAYYQSDALKATQKDSRHLLTVVQNETGWKNLLKLTYHANIPVKDGGTFFYRPRFTDKMIFEHQEGLIFSSACLNGVIADYIMKGDETAARLEALKWKENVEHFYAEIMPHRFDDQIMVNKKIVEIARDLDIPLLCTLDVHYEKPEQHESWLINGAIRRRQNVTDFQPNMTPDMYYKPIEQIMADLRLSGLTEQEIMQSIQNSVKIADMCNFKWENRQNDQPVFNADINAEQHLKQISWQGLCTRFGGKSKVPQQYIDRLKEEYHVICKMGFANYFLILHDMISYAKSNGVIVGPGRGSACGSMMLWALHVTEVDSLKYNLPFARFLNEERLGTVPDVDMDMDPAGRELTINYLKKKYGYDHVFQVSNHAELKAKGAIKDVARFYNYTFDQSEKLTEHIPTKFENDEGEQITPTIKEVVEMPQMKVFVEHDPRLFEIAADIEGSYRQCLTGDTRIICMNNHSITIKELFDRKTKRFPHGKKQTKMRKRKIDIIIRSLDNNGNISGDKVVDVFEQGEKEVFEITTKSGKKIKATEDHLFLTKNEWVKLKDLNIGDKVIVNGKSN